jgi:hypothetical protein
MLAGMPRWNVALGVDASQHQISRISLRCRMLWLRWLTTIRPCFEMMYCTLTNRWRFRYERFSFQWRGRELMLMRLPASGAGLAASLPRGGSRFYLAHVRNLRFKLVEGFDIEARRLATDRASSRSSIRGRPAAAAGRYHPQPGSPCRGGRGARSRPKNPE